MNGLATLWYPDPSYFTPFTVVVSAITITGIYCLKKRRNVGEADTAILGLGLGPVFFVLVFFVGGFGLFSMLPRMRSFPDADSFLGSYIGLGGWYLAARIAMSTKYPQAKVIGGIELCLIACILIGEIVAFFR